MFPTYTEEEISVWDDIDRTRAERGETGHVADSAEDDDIWDAMVAELFLQNLQGLL